MPAEPKRVIPTHDLYRQLRTWSPMFSHQAASFASCPKIAFYVNTSNTLCAFLSGVDNSLVYIEPTHRIILGDPGQDVHSVAVVDVRHARQPDTYFRIQKDMRSLSDLVRAIVDCTENLNCGSDLVSTLNPHALVSHGCRT